MASRLGNWAVLFFGFGLAAAGMTSSVTAPLAAAITGRSLFGANDAKWQNKAINFRLVWGSIFLIGLIFSLIGIQPIPAIILAQAINGALLPIVTIFLLLAVNDKNILLPDYTNKPFTNILMLIIVGVTCFLGLNNIWKALARIIPVFASSQELALWLNIAISGIILLWLTRIVFVKK
jgi:Mn2+/Fe2+ NRAMP family transporter